MFTDPGGTFGGGFTSSIPKGDGGTRIYITVSPSARRSPRCGEGGRERRSRRRRLISEEIGYWATSPIRREN